MQGIEDLRANETKRRPMLLRWHTIAKFWKKREVETNMLLADSQ